MDDIPRLLIYTLPLVLPLALNAVGARPTRRADTPAKRPAVRSWYALAVAGIFFLPLVHVDRYQRIEWKGPRDGPRLRWLFRESLRVARQLEAGEEATLRPIRYVRTDGVTGQLQREIHWYHLEGWGTRIGRTPEVQPNAAASVLVPCLRPADWNLTLSFASPGRSVVALNGKPLRLARREDDRDSFIIPAEFLIRGDNVLSLEGSGRDVLRVREIKIEPLRASDPE